MSHHPPRLNMEWHKSITSAFEL